MTKIAEYEIFLVAPPGLEEALYHEVLSHKFKAVRQVLGGVTLRGSWPDVWRANLVVRGCSRVLVRIGSFYAAHLAQLDKHSRHFPWRDFLKPEVPVQIAASCTKSKIYHSGAVIERFSNALKAAGFTINDEAPLTLKIRLERDLCTISLDSSGEILHKRGHKQAMAKAPMRENLAALFLRLCNFNGTEPVYDPMCGSGTFVIEAAEMALGLRPGRNRSFAFELLPHFDEAHWQGLKAAAPPPAQDHHFYGSDRNEGAIAMSQTNAKLAGVAAYVTFQQAVISDMAPPCHTPGLIIVNPPYGNRLSDKKSLSALYRRFGEKAMALPFKGWRLGLITTDFALAKATGLPFSPPGPPVNHGGLRVYLFQAQL